MFPLLLSVYTDGGKGLFFIDMNIKPSGIVSFEDNTEFREFLGKRISGEGPIYIQIVDNYNDFDNIIKSKRIPLTVNTCKVYKEGPYTSLIFDKLKLKALLDL